MSAQRKPIRLRVLSDLHREIKPKPIADGIRDDIPCDVVVLAGDIAAGIDGIEWAARTFARPVVYVMGNHEYYDHRFEALIARARRRANAVGVHLLDRNEVTIMGLRLLGCTLWSGLDSGSRSWQQVAQDAHWYLDDFSRIRCEDRAFTPLAMVETYERDRGWLESALKVARPAVVVTHFAPTLRTRSPRFAEDDPLTAYFHTDLEYLMGPAAPVWIHGHTHHSMAVTIAANAGETRIVSNQSGYPDEETGFVVDYVIEV